MAYFSCVQLHPPAPAPSYLFEYNNLTIINSEDIVDTGVKWDTDTFSNKSWSMELMINSMQGSGSERGIFYSYNTGNNMSIVYDTSGYIRYYNGTKNPRYTNLCSISFGKSAELIYDGNGTLDVYVDDEKVNTITNFDPGYISGTGSANAIIGAYQTVEVFNGTFDYIRMKFLN